MYFNNSSNGDRVNFTEKTVNIAQTETNKSILKKKLHTETGIYNSVISQVEYTELTFK